jgi:hypothetical protein
MPKLRVSHEFQGYSDYWRGNGRRWDKGAGCLFAYYGPDTTLRDCVDQWVDDFWGGGDFEHHDDGPDAFEGITQDHLRQAILQDFLNEQGRKDYESGALCEFAAECEDNRTCCDCGAGIGDSHNADCDDGDVGPDDCDDDDWEESPIWIILVEIDVCKECGKGCDHTVDDLCADCGAKQYPSDFNNAGELIV